MNGTIKTNLDIDTSYELTDEQVTTLKRWRHFKAHTDQTARYIKINQQTKSLAYLLMTICPESIELQNSIDRLEEVRNWAIQAITKNERDYAHKD